MKDRRIQSQWVKNLLIPIVSAILGSALGGLGVYLVAKMQIEESFELAKIQSERTYELGKELVLWELKLNLFEETMILVSETPLKSIREVDISILMENRDRYMSLYFRSDFLFDNHRIAELFLEVIEGFVSMVSMSKNTFLDLNDSTAFADIQSRSMILANGLTSLMHVELSLEPSH